MTKVQIIYTFCGIGAFAILVFVHLVIRPLFRRKSKNTVRKNIKLYVDKIEKSFRGKITTLEPEWKRKGSSETYAVKLPFSDINDFKNLSDLYDGAENLLSKKEMNSIHELIETFEKEKYNADISISPSGEVINFKSVYKISDLAKKLQELIKKKIE